MSLDTVQSASAETEVELEVTQPYAELGLTTIEYEKIIDILGRRPTQTELT